MVLHSLIDYKSGIESAIDDEIERGTLPLEGDPGVIVTVRAGDADDARRILTEDG